MKWQKRLCLENIDIRTKRCKRAINMLRLGIRRRLVTAGLRFWEAPL